MTERNSAQYYVIRSLIYINTVRLESLHLKVGNERGGNLLLAVQTCHRADVRAVGTGTIVNEIETIQ